jgi:hypothetical protein
MMKIGSVSIRCRMCQDEDMEDEFDKLNMKKIRMIMAAFVLINLL